MLECELRLMAVRGDRRDGLRELRRLTGRPVAELNALLDHLPAPVWRGAVADGRGLVLAATSLLEVQLLVDGVRDPATAAGQVGPHVEWRIEVERVAESVRFAVDDVAPALGEPEVEPESDCWAALADGVPVETSSRRGLVRLQAVRHPLAAAIQMAFDEHRRLRLTPDAVWLTIASGFAQHVDQRAETLRSRFVRHPGRKTLAVQWRGSWAATIAALSEVTAVELGEGRRRMFRCDFSTTTDTDRIASDVVFLATFKRYFDLIAVGICGIPEIELVGTVADWTTIRERIEVLAEYDAEYWVATLRPLADELVMTARGTPDVAFWRAIYKPQKAYQLDAATGWITQLFPYLEDNSANPVIGTGGPQTGYTYAPLQLNRVPLGLVRAPVRTEDRGTFDLLGGLAGVTCDPDAFLTPVSGWSVVHRPFSRLLDRLEQEHELFPPTGEQIADDGGLPAELLELYSRCDGGPIHGGRWHIRRPRDVQLISTEPPADAPEGQIHLLQVGTVFADLQDGRRAVLLYHFIPGANRADWWVNVLPSQGPLLRDAPIVAKGLDSFLTALLNEDARPFFEEPDFTPEGIVADANREVAP
jgi:hypothetical protein